MKTDAAGPRRVSPTLKIAMVGGGYLAATGIATAVVALRIAATSGPDAQASSGMYAFGDALIFVAVFGVCALIPTAAALYFLRPYARFWTVLAALALALAITSLVAAILYAVGRSETGTTLALWAQFSVLRILIAPLFALTFMVSGILCPHRTQRRTLLAATAIEAAVSAFALVVWFVPLFLGRD